MRIDISRMSRILPILSILILGGFQTTSAMEYLITTALGGTNKAQDITVTQGDSITPLQVYVYLKYTSAEVAKGGGSGWLNGNLLFSSSDSSTAYMNGDAAQSTATSQAGAYTVQNVGATGTTTNNWNGGITALFSADRAILQATYEADGSPSNVFGTSATNYLYLATATLTFNTGTAGTTTISANPTGVWTDNNFIDYTLGYVSFTITINAVPEPTTYALAALSCVALGAIGRRKTLKAKKQETASA